MGTLYFRANKYPTDWAAAKDCTRLLRSFSAAQMLKEYGKRFIGAPAHLQPEVARPMQLELNALPEAFRPPTSLETVESEEDYYGAPLRPPPIVLFIIDGVGDNTYPELGNRTPLEVVAGVEPRECAIEKHASSSLWTEAETYCQANGGTSLKSRLTPFYNPALSAVARQGVSGMLDPYEAGRSCGSDTAHLSLFGYPPTEYYRGRGAYEALGAGLQLGEGDIAFKSNFCTQLETTATDEEALRYNQQNFFDLHPDKSTEAVLQEVRAQWTAAGEDPTAFITFRRCDRDFTREGPILCEYLNDTVVDTDREGVPLPFVHRIKVQYATEHRCGLSLTEGTPNTAYTKNKYDRYLDLEGELSDYITGTDPLKDGRYLLRCKPKSNADATKSERELRTAAYTSLVVERASQVITERLSAHPINEERRAHNRQLFERRQRGEKVDDEYKNIANTILFRGAAKKGFVPLFSVRHGLVADIIAPTCIIRGLGACCGMKAYTFPTTTTTLNKEEDPYTHKGVATGDFYSDVTVKLDALREILNLEKNRPITKSKTNFVVLHVKGVDDAGHDKNGFQKLYYLSHKCSLVMEALLSDHGLPQGSVLGVLADHSTPLYIGDHCCEPVPFSVCVVGNDKDKNSKLCDGVQEYTEISVTEGGAGRFRGEHVVPLLKKMRSHFHY
ncbi:phosphoglycerate mutase [Angomonas deanei]|nr:phosphoglycerate mutase [Angomonas deanei]|eukprot:EPY43270.1 phosphoglycerate mutase [Angomonas deanei]